jgi:pimeloyl-ACP methyl ester carboxylesterase
MEASEASEFTPGHRGGEGSPLVLLHGFTDTWRCWELVLPALEAEHDVLAPTLAGHAGGPAIGADEDPQTAIADAVERAMDEAGFETAHVAGNSLGGWIALQLAARGRARTVTALAPAGGWAADDPAIAETIQYFRTSQMLLEQALPHADAIVATVEGRAQATQMYISTPEHMTPELIVHQMRGATSCPAVMRLIEHAEASGWNLDAERIACPVRIVWGDGDRILVPPGATARFREEWLPQAEFVELAGAGHCPQLDHPLEVSQLILDFAR